MLSLVLAAALVTQTPMARPMTPAERAAYMKKEGFIHFTPSPEMKARQRKFDAQNRVHAKSVSDMKFTIWGGIKFARQYPPGSPQLREYQRRLRGR